MRSPAGLGLPWGRTTLLTGLRRTREGELGPLVWWVTWALGATRILTGFTGFKVVVKESLGSVTVSIVSESGDEGCSAWRHSIWNFGVSKGFGGAMSPL